MDPAPPTKTLGLVAGLGVGAGIFYYRALVQAHLTRQLVPRLVMVHADGRRVVALANARAVHELAGYLAGLIDQLVRAGAEVATIPAFAPQICAAELAAITPLPLVSVVDAIAADIAGRGLRRVALFGARVTMDTRLFGRLPELEIIAPAADEANRIATIYAQVVERGHGMPADHAELRALAHALIAREQLDAIVLAGTELALVFEPGNTDFQHVDGARVHLDALMRAIVAAP